MRLIIIGIVIFGAIAGVTLYYALPEFRAVPGVPPVESASAIEGILTVLSTRVFVQAPSQAESTEVEDSAAVGVGSRIKTSLDGRGLLELPDRAAVTIDQNSAFTIEASKNETRLSVATGNVWTRTKKLFDQDELYEVRSPNAVATVRGTSFSFGYAGRVSAVLVADGRVSVTALDPASGALIPETTALVKAGEKAIIDDRKPISERVLIFRSDAADLNSEWYRLNNPRPDDGSPLPAQEITPTPVREPAPAPELPLPPPPPPSSPPPKEPPPPSPSRPQDGALLDTNEDFNLFLPIEGLR